MGLTRSSSGLLVYDAFGSDTLANYTFTATAGEPTWEVSSGVLSQTTASPNSGGMGGRTGQSTVKCVTGRYRRVGSGSYSALAIVGNFTPDASGYFPSYMAKIGAGDFALWKRASNGTSSLATASYTNTASSYYQSRIYINDGTVYGLHGTTDFSGASLNASDAAYSAGAAGFLVYKTGGVDWFEARTAHTITCTGMTEGHYLRVSDGTTAAEAAASGAGLASVDAGAVLFPLASVQIRTAAAGGGDLIAELDTGDYADMGGGDAFKYSASGLWLPQLIKPQYFPQFGGLTYG